MVIEVSEPNAAEEGARRPDAWTVALIAVPVVLVVAAGWSHRWTADDAFINVRVVQQIFDGHGPVFNAGERVEVASSTLWLATLVVAHALFFWVPIEWTAVVLGLATTGGAVLLAQLTSLRLLGLTRAMPFGVVAFIALPPVWDFATSGLETGLSLLWIAASAYGLVAAARTERRRTCLLAGLCIGLAPLVRPDFLTFGVVFGIALLLVARPQTARGLAELGVGSLALPAAYECFRVVYYGALEPNTAFAKEAGKSSWQQGRWYLADFNSPYWLWLLLILAAAVLLVFVVRADSTSRILLLTPVVAGLAHGFFVVRGGGDHMHGRLLLPALFAILLPIAVLPRSAQTLAPAVLALAWVAIPVFSGGPPYDVIGPHEIADEHRVSVPDIDDHPVTVSDFLRSDTWLLAATGVQAAAGARDGARELLIVDLAGGGGRLPLAASVPYREVLAVSSIGIAGVAAGTDVYVADRLSLADPIGARIELHKRGKPGHEKLLPMSWFIARFVDPEAAVPVDIATARQIDAARRALGCPEVRDLLQRARSPLDPGQAVHNAISALTDFTTRIDRNPRVVAEECG